MNFVKIIILFPAIIYLAAIATLYLAQKHLVFAVKKLPSNYKFNFKSNFSEGFFESSKGKKINYLVFKQENPGQIIIYYRGNAQALDQWGLTAKQLSKKTNSEVWVFDYPGFGKSGGPLASSSMELLQLAEDFYAHVIENTSLETKLVLYGRSLGSGLASHVAASHKLNNIILETPYYSTKKVALERFPFIPGFLFKYNLDNSVLKGTKANNILIFHGTDDKVIPYHHAKNLAEQLKGSKFITLEGGTHGNLESYTKYQNGIDNYFEGL